MIGILRMARRLMQVGSLQFSLLVAAYFAWGLNFPVLFRAYGKLSEMGVESIGLRIALPLVLFLFFVCVVTPFCVKNLERPFFIVLTLVSSLAGYGAWSYHVIYGPEVMLAIAATDYREASSFLSLPLVTWFVFFGVLPAVYLAGVKIIHPPLLRDIAQKSMVILTALFTMLVLGLFFYKKYALIENFYTPILTRMIIPAYAVVTVFKLAVVNSWSEPVEYKEIGLDAVRRDAGRDGRRNLLILAVGESARAANFQYEGYPRETNRHTKDLGMLYFRNTRACSTATLVALPCMFSSLGREEFSMRRARNQDNLFDLLARAGLSLLWLDNDLGCQKACRTVPVIPLTCGGFSVCPDEGLLEELRPEIRRQGREEGGDSVIVLHLRGSHYSYYHYYPSEHRHFTPDCRRNDLQNCSREELFNAYDNSILYTDFVLSRVIDILRDEQDTWNSALLYTSDHGESLGEDGLYLHGTPYAFAPEEQKRVPFLAWFSEGFVRAGKLDRECLAREAAEREHSHDNLFHSVLGLMEVETTVRRDELDVFSRCRDRP